MLLSDQTNMLKETGLHIWLFLLDSVLLCLSPVHSRNIGNCTESLYLLYTWTTPVECSEHNVPMNASPTVDPSKSIALDKGMP